jgi:NTP pyrophosphatase (non-canonical NTP hydrolase)
MGRKLNDGFVPARKNRVLVCEGLDFWWDEPELDVIVKMWKGGLSIKQMADRFERDPDEVLLAIIHLAREDLIKSKLGGAFGMRINELCNAAFETAKSKGWHDEPRETGTLLALIHSEVSEALEADRKGDTENFAEELADVCIRIFDLCGSKGIDLEAAIYKKMERNKGRSYKHGGKAY